MLSLFKKFFQKQAGVAIRASFDAASPSRSDVRHWAAADDLRPDSAAAPDVRRTLRNRSRYEIENNAYAKGLVQTLANDTIGKGPRLQLLDADEVRNADLEKSFQRWAEEINLSAKLRTMRMARCQDGEAFALLITNPKLQHPIKLDVIPIEADRIQGECTEMPDNRSVDGIAYDRYGNPVSYRVLHYATLDDLSASSADRIPAENMLHIYREDRPGLHRGVPELTAALPLFAQLRRYNSAVLAAAEASADFAGILYTDSPANGETMPVEPLENFPLEKNSLVSLPAGWKFDQLDGKQPTTKHAEFTRTVLTEIARCVSATYGILAGDFSGHNYASGRLDVQNYQKSITVDRSLWEVKVLNPVFRRWYREFALANADYRKEPDFLWYWDAFQHVDPVKEANAQALRLANHTSTLAAECAREGADYIEVLNQCKKEHDLMSELGLPDSFVFQSNLKSAAAESSTEE